MSENPTIEELEKALNEQDTTDTSISLADQVAIMQNLRRQYVVQFHTLKSAAKINSKVGNKEQAQSQYQEATKILELLKEIDIEISKG